MKAHLLHACGPLLVGVVSAVLAPRLGTDSLTPSDMGLFFSTTAVITAALLVPLSLLAAFPARVGHRIRKSLSPVAFVWFGLGEAGGILGLVPTWPIDAYRYFFAISLAGAAAAVATVVCIGIVNLRAQQQADDAIMGKSPGH